jgi:hypothetical protein
LSDNVAGTGLPEDRYGEETFTAYLVAAEDCYAQALPSLPAYQSMEGGGCWLDIHPSENAPVLPVPEVCGDPPLTSLCFLDRIGMIDRASEGLAGIPRVALEGYFEPTTVCESTEKGTANQDCREREIFHPCRAEPR